MDLQANDGRPASYSETPFHLRQRHGGSCKSVLLAASTKTTMTDFLFTLPDEVIASLSLRSFHAKPESDVVTEEQEATTSLGCSTCQIIALDSVTAQRAHFKSDWHKYNLKHKLAVTEDQFDQLADGALPA